MSDEQQQLTDEQLEEAAFAQGMAEARGEPLPEPEKEVEPKAEPQEPEAVAPEQAATPEPAPPTLEQRLAAIESNFPSIQNGLNSLAGRLGGLNRDLQSLKTIRETQPQDSPAVAAQSQIVADKLKRLNADYPELAAALAEDLNGIIGAPPEKAAPKIDEEAIWRRAEERAIEKVERRFLAREHPNWEQDIALKDEVGRPLRDPSGKYLPSPVFVEWLQSKPEVFRQQFVGAVDSDFLGSGLREFKEYRSKRLGQGTPQSAPQSSPARAAPAPASSKQARLAAAITPKPVASTSGSAAISEDDAFVAGFKSARGQY